jgi:hypothetical protein
MRRLPIADAAGDAVRTHARMPAMRDTAGPRHAQDAALPVRHANAISDRRSHAGLRSAYTEALLRFRQALSAPDNKKRGAFLLFEECRKGLRRPLHAA